MQRIVASGFVLLSFAIVTGALAADFDPSKIPQDDLRELARNAPEVFTELATSSERRLSLLGGAWVRAQRAHPIDNRPYVAALMIDLYNSLPPDLEPPPQCPPGIDYECDVDESRLAPLKEQWNGEIGGFIGVATMPNLVREREQAWDRAVKRDSEVAKEIYYLQQYLREYIWPQMDAPGAVASLDPRALDLSNPTHYAELARWMAETVTARADGVPPWEAIKQFPGDSKGVTSPSIASAVSDAAPLTATTEASTIPAVTPPAPEPEQITPNDDPAESITDDGRLLVWLLALVGGVIAVLLWRRARR